MSSRTSNFHGSIFENGSNFAKKPSLSNPARWRMVRRWSSSSWPQPSPIPMRAYSSILSTRSSPSPRSREPSSAAVCASCSAWSAPQSYGKAALVGVNGEYEQGNAFLTNEFADPIGTALGGGKSWVPSTGKRGGPGTTLDIPLAHKDALYVRSHYDTVSVTFTDSPGPDEVVMAVAVATRRRLLARLGGLRRPKSWVRRTAMTGAAANSDDGLEEPERQCTASAKFAPAERARRPARGGKWSQIVLQTVGCPSIHVRAAAWVGRFLRDLAVACGCDLHEVSPLRSINVGEERATGIRIATTTPTRTWPTLSYRRPLRPRALLPPGSSRWGDAPRMPMRAGTPRGSGHWSSRTLHRVHRPRARVRGGSSPK